MDIRSGMIVGRDEDDNIVSVPVIELVLSERNLRTLLLTIDEEENGVSRFTESGVFLQIRAESNEVHYKDRAAGLMGEDVESKLIRDELGGDETLFIPPDLGKNLN